jgi:hypothetical protein
LVDDAIDQGVGSGGAGERQCSQNRNRLDVALALDSASDKALSMARARFKGPTKGRLPALFGALALRVTPITGHRCQQTAIRLSANCSVAV